MEKSKLDPSTNRSWNRAGIVDHQVANEDQLDDAIEQVQAINLEMPFSKSKEQAVQKYTCGEKNHRRPEKI